MRGLRGILPTALLIATNTVAVVACGSDSGPCADFRSPSRSLETACDPANLDDPTALGSCLAGSGYAGAWSVDGDGLPAFDFRLEHRCDAVARVLSDDGVLAQAPIHLLGSGDGTVALAHASGAIELLRQERGRTVLNKVDEVFDEDNPDVPQQLGGGHSYVVTGDRVESTRYEDFGVGKASKVHERRFGVGYLETATELKDVVVRRRVFPAPGDVRALIAEVTVENTSKSDKALGLVEFWDLNLAPLTDAAAESTSALERVRAQRGAGGLYQQTLSYAADEQVASATFEATSLPPGVSDASSPAGQDFFLSEVFLAAVDEAEGPDAVWLSEEELWDSPKRPVPKAVAADAQAEARSLALSGNEGILALRVPVFVPRGASVTRRFAIGYATANLSASEAVALLRDEQTELRKQAVDTWKERLAWFAVDAADSGVIQREVAWSSYYAQAGAFYDERVGVRVLGVGGAAQYARGLTGNAGDLARNAEGLALVNAQLAGETLQYAFSTQHGEDSETPYRLVGSPVGASLGFQNGEFEDRSDGYVHLLSALGSYMAISRDRDVETEKLPHWPPSETSSDLRQHILGLVDYATTQLEGGRHGILALGTGDGAALAEGVSENLAGAESQRNAAVAIAGVGQLNSMLEPGEDLSALLALRDRQEGAIKEAWNGTYYERGLDADGEPLSGGEHVGSQALAVLADIADEERAGALLARMTSHPAPAYEGGPIVLRDAFLAAEAIATSDPERGWQALVSSSMASQADLFPDLGYRVWAGPGRVYGPDHEDPGAVVADAAGAASAFPYASTELHVAMLRAVTALCGVHASGSGWRIAPRFPSESFSVKLSDFELRGTPTSIAGSVRAAASELLDLEVALPSGLRAEDVRVRVKEAEVEAEALPGNVVRFPYPVRAGEHVPFSIEAR